MGITTVQRYCAACDEASFKTFRKNNVFFSVIVAPVTMQSFVAPFHLYNVVKLSLLTPEKNNFYCRLATNVKAVAFTHDADYITEINEGNEILSGNVWQIGDASILFIDRTRPTCARALIAANLPELKTYCRYFIHKPRFPQGAIKVAPNTHLLTNISTVAMHCYGQKSTDNIVIHTLHLSEIQVIYAVLLHVFTQLSCLPGHRQLDGPAAILACCCSPTFYFGLAA